MKNRGPRIFPQRSLSFRASSFPHARFARRFFIIPYSSYCPFLFHSHCIRSFNAIALEKVLTGRCGICEGEGSEVAVTFAGVDHRHPAAWEERPMIERAKREGIFLRGHLRIRWEGEPMLGSMYGEEEIEAAVAAMRDAMEPSRGFSGGQIADFEAAFADYVGTKHAIAVNSAGPGLDMTMRYLNLEPGDEVIVPAINFVASPMAVMGAGGQVVWCDVNPRTLQMDPEDVERRITPRTRALFPVHMNGLAAPLDELYEVAARHPHTKHGSIPVICDAARAAGGFYKGEPIGRKGFATIFSFHTMKNMVTLGEGGMVVTDNDDFDDYCRSTRFYGFGREVWGSSHVMTKVQAAVGMVQLGRLDDFVLRRRRLAHIRHDLLEGVPELITPFEPDDRIHTFYLYTCLVCEDWAGEKRDALIKKMDEDYNVRCLVANRPVYVDRKVMRDHTPGQSLPQSERLGERILCVPIHPAMSDEDNEFICAALIECVEKLR
jgi:dTDP-4-amino-4,6-dideoxygalactose transaminase